MRIPLTAYLLRRGVDPVGSVHRSALSRVDLSNWVENRLVPIVVDPDGDASPSLSKVVVGLSSHPSEKPPWQSLIADMLGIPNFGGRGQSRGAIIYCRIQLSDEEPRWVAWCFGSGARLLVRKATDPRFGLLAALNTLVARADGYGSRSPQLRNLEYRETTPYFKQTGHRAARDIPVDAFRIDRTSDLLSGAGGHTTDPVFADVYGSRALKFRHEVGSVADLIHLSGLVVERSATDRYKEHVGWADNIWLVDDPVLEGRLRDGLWTMLTTSPIDASMDALIPDDLVSFDDDRSIQYIAYPRERGGHAGRTTLTPEMLAQYVTGSRVGTAGPELLEVELRFLDAGEEHIGTASIQECLYAEQILEGQRFIAYEGGFFGVDKDFVAGIDAEIDEIPLTGIDLPCYRGGREDGYIAAVGREHPDRFAILDQRYLRLPGQTPIEPCDLLSSAAALVHLKRKGKASVLSHLFNQVTSACALIKEQPEARDQLETLIQATDAGQTLKDAASDRIRALSPGTDGVEVVFGFLGDWRDKTAHNLPLLSRIALVTAARQVRLLGYHPTLALVDLCR